MKKILTTLSLVAGNVAIVLAQTTVNIGQVANQGTVNGGAIYSLLNIAQTLVTRLVPFAIGAAVLVFFFFLIKFVINSNEPEAKGANLKGMGYSILALFVMVSIWGLVGLLGSLLGVGQGGGVPIPAVPVNPAVY